jgi:hypothetical protein
MLESLIESFRIAEPVIVPPLKPSRGWDNLVPLATPDTFRDSAEEHLEWAKHYKPLRFAHAKPICGCGSYTVIERIDNLTTTPVVIAACDECEARLPLNLQS